MGAPNLFRVFDVAFFVPGGLVLGAAHYGGLLPIPQAWATPQYRASEGCSRW